MTIKECLNCARSDNDVPLITLHYAGLWTWICPQCLPLLIHQPERLAERLAKTREMEMKSEGQSANTGALPKPL